MGNITLSLSNMRGLSLACLVLLAGLVVAQDTTESSTERDTAETTTQTPASPTTTISTTTTSTTSTTTPSPTTTTTEHPVVILKQVNEINEDGSYTVGYEASDGTFRLETKDAEGNVEGKYGFLDENGEIKIVEYSANNSTGFTSDLELSQVNALTEVEAAPQKADPAFELEKKRHEAVIAFQKAVVEKQQKIAQQNDASAQRQNFASARQGARRPVFNAANFNPSRPASEQFNTGNFQQDFRDFQQQQQQPNQFQAQFQQNQQFAQNPQQFQQNQQFAQNPQQFQQPRQFAPQPQQPNPAFQFQQRPQQQQQFAPQQQFAQQPQQFAPQRPQQPAQIPVAQLTREQIALEGFSRDDDQDGQIDPLPAHLLPQQQPQQFAPQQPQQPRQFFPQQQQQFFQQPQQQQQNFAQNPQFFQQQQQSFRPPQPVGPSPAQSRPQFT